MTVPRSRQSWIVAVVIAATACTRADGTRADSTLRSVAKAAGAAEVSAGLVTEYPPAATKPAQWNFDSMSAGAPPRGFLFARTGGGSVGQWVVRASSDAPTTPNVLVQVDTDRTSDRFPVAVVDAVSVRDVEVSVRCRPVSGQVDQACGLVWRYRDENNYYVTRANALEGNVRLYYVRDGRRRQIADWHGSVTRGRWHTLGVRAVGDQIDVTWNGAPIITKRDETFKEAGRIGVWLKADSYTEYDDLSMTPVPQSEKPR